MNNESKKLLVCTIMRNAAPHVPHWAARLNELAEILQKYFGWETYLSVVENDSTDGTVHAFEDIKWGHSIKQRSFLTQTLGTFQYGSVWSLDRLRNLANARQECLSQAEERWGLATFDKIAYIEVDVQYDPMWCWELIVGAHFDAARLPQPDIYSGWSLRSMRNPKESQFLYDSCATRQDSTDTCWDFRKEYDWRANRLIQTYLSHENSNCLYPVWSTFNCFCVYNAAPFADANNPIKWGYINRRLDNGQQRIEDGFLEADTVVVCEDFRARGMSGVYLNTNCLVRHA